MANMIQQVMYEGHLGSDPRASYMPNGKMVVNFSIGSTREFKTADGEKKSITTWLKVSAFAGLAEVVNQYCGKGSHVIVTGYLRPGEGGNPAVFEMKDGGFGASYEMVANTIRILKGRDNSSAESAGDSEDDTPY